MKYTPKIKDKVEIVKCAYSTNESHKGRVGRVLKVEDGQYLVSPVGCWAEEVKPLSPIKKKEPKKKTVKKEKPMIDCPVCGAETPNPDFKEVKKEKIEKLDIKECRGSGGFTVTMGVSNFEIARKLNEVIDVLNKKD